MNRHFIGIVLLVISLFILSGCAAAEVELTKIPTETLIIATETKPPVETEVPTEPVATVSDSVEATEEPTEMPTQEPTPTITLDDWRSLPVLPDRLSETVLTIYKLGKIRGNNPNAFSKVGDCNSIYPDFLGYYEFTPERIRWGEYGELERTLNYFEGSWGRESLAAKVGLTATSVMAPLWNDWRVCAANETPLDCEYRMHQPAFAIISFGTNDVAGTVDFENSLRRVIEDTIGNGVVPILSTKADNVEGDYSYNRKIVELAYEYDLPIWNFWATVQHLPDKGLEGIEHLTYSDRISWVNFEARASLSFGWTIRNLSGLQLMDRMRELILEAEENNEI